MRYFTGQNEVVHLEIIMETLHPFLSFEILKILQRMITVKGGSMWMKSLKIIIFLTNTFTLNCAVIWTVVGNLLTIIECHRIEHGKFCAEEVNWLIMGSRERKLSQGGRGSRARRGEGGKWRKELRCVIGMGRLHTCNLHIMEGDGWKEEEGMRKRIYCVHVPALHSSVNSMCCKYGKTMIWKK